MMTKSKLLYSIILTNYNQENYIYNALDSILAQTFQNIELIITDDASKIFEKEKIKKYIKNNNKGNIKNFKFSINKKNIGTVKTLNKAYKLCTGDYTLIFAADDCLYDEMVLEKFFRKIKETKSNIINGKCKMYDVQMKTVVWEFPPQFIIDKMQKMSAKEQNLFLMRENAMAPGATIFKTEILKQNNYLDENYKYIEDWPMFLKYTRLGNKIYFCDFPVLKHRGGGISEKKLNKEFKYSLLQDFKNIYKKEILPYLNLHDKENLTYILEKYWAFIQTFTYFDYNEAKNYANDTKKYLEKLNINFTFKFIKSIISKFKLLFYFSIISSLLLSSFLLKTDNSSLKILVPSVLFLIIYKTPLLLKKIVKRFGGKNEKK